MGLLWLAVAVVLGLSLGHFLRLIRRSIRSRCNRIRRTFVAI